MDEPWLRFRFDGTGAELAMQAIQVEGLDAPPAKSNRAHEGDDRHQLWARWTLIAVPEDGLVHAQRTEDLSLFAAEGLLVLYGEARARDDAKVMATASAELETHLLGPAMVAMVDSGDLTWDRRIDRTDLAAVLLARSVQPEVSEEERVALVARALELDAYDGLVHHVVAARGL